MNISGLSIWQRQSQGQAKTRKHINDGELVPKTYCEICGREEGLNRKNGHKGIRIVPHHYKGYEYTMDVWWICRACNLLLSNKHDHSIKTLDAARVHIFNDPMFHYKNVDRDEVKNRISLLQEELLIMKRRLKWSTVLSESQRLLSYIPCIEG